MFFWHYFTVLSECPTTATLKSGCLAALIAVCVSVYNYHTSDCFQPNGHCSEKFLSLSEACLMCARSVNIICVCRPKWLHAFSILWTTHTHTAIMVLTFSCLQLQQLVIVDGFKRWDRDSVCACVFFFILNDIWVLKKLSMHTCLQYFLNTLYFAHLL